MGRTYYEIEVTARQLTGLLVLLAVLLVVAFVLGYGAAWSVLSDRSGPPSGLVSEATPTALPEVVVPTPTEPPQLSTVDRPEPTAAPTVAVAPTRVPTRVPTRPPATAAPSSRDGFWVQVLAVRTEGAVREARSKLDRLGFPRDHQWVVAAATAGGDTLYKVRVGPFPDRVSADRVVRRMAAGDFPDAWVVTP